MTFEEQVAGEDRRLKENYQTAKASGDLRAMERALKILGDFYEWQFWGDGEWDQTRIG